MAVTNRRPAPPSYLFLYSVVLFSAAFVLVLLSYLSQEHSRRQIDESLSILSSRQSLELVYDENKALTERVASLEALLGSVDRDALPDDDARALYDELVGAP